MQRQYTVSRDKEDTRDHLVRLAVPALPLSIDLSQWLGPVKDQGSLGACTGFAFAGLREYLWRRFHTYEKAAMKFLGQNLVFSPMFIYYMERLIEGDIFQDGGADSRTGMKVLTKYGVCRESEDPYNIGLFTQAPDDSDFTEALQFNVGAYHRVVDLQTLKSVLATGYVASMAFAVYDSFESSQTEHSGIVTMPTPREKVLGGHEVLVYGSDDVNRVLLCRNSWGQDWGQQGNFKLPYEYFNLTEGVYDMWTAHLGAPWK